MNSIQDLIGVQMKQISECGECNSKSEKNETLLGLVIGLPPEEELVYKVTYVPYSHSMTLVDIKTYAFKLKRGAKLVAMNLFRKTTRRSWRRQSGSATKTTC